MSAIESIHESFKTCAHTFLLNTHVLTSTTRPTQEVNTITHRLQHKGTFHRSTPTSTPRDTPHLGKPPLVANCCLLLFLKKLYHTSQCGSVIQCRSMVKTQSSYAALRLLSQKIFQRRAQHSIFRLASNFIYQLYAFSAGSRRYCFGINAVNKHSWDAHRVLKNNPSHTTFELRNNHPKILRAPAGPPGRPVIPDYSTTWRLRAFP